MGESPAATVHLTRSAWQSACRPIADHSQPDLVAQAFARLDDFEEHLRAFVEVTSDVRRPGRRTARRGDQEIGGPLDGLPFAVKGLSGYRSPVTRRLVAAGAVPIGATSTPQGGGYQTWGFTERGPTRNPWRPDLSPGGSSAGSAAAVAAGVVELATGSDGAGSVRIPAAWCSVLGYKPTTGVAPCSDPTGLATPGVLARDPRWLSAWADVVLDPFPGVPDGKAATVVWSDDLGRADADLDDEVAGIARRAAERLARAAGLSWRSPAVALLDPRAAWVALRDPDAGADRRRAADRDRRDLGEELAGVFFGADLLMCPTTPRRPHGHHGPGEHLSVALTWGFNLTGHPAVSVPAGFTDDGCPVGLQIVARPYADRSLLTLLEQHVPTAAIAPVPTGRSQR